MTTPLAEQVSQRKSVSEGEPRDNLSAALVILLYNSADYVAPCLMSVARQERPPDELIIVDNASRDSSADVAEKVVKDLGLAAKILRQENNLGCCGGNNVGWRNSTSDVVVFLNPDTELTPRFLSEILIPLTSDPKVGIVGCKIYYPGTTVLQHAGACIFSNGRTEHFGAGKEDCAEYSNPRECDYVTGAAFAVRREILELLNGFDEDFFPAYYEEVDLCTRARAQGWKILYWPTAVLYHHESVSLGVESERFLMLYHRMRMRYCLKHLSFRQWLFEFIPEEIRLYQHNPPHHRRAIRSAWRDAFVWRLRKATHRSS